MNRLDKFSGAQENFISIGSQKWDFHAKSRQKSIKKSFFVDFNLICEFFSKFYIIIKYPYWYFRRNKNSNWIYEIKIDEKWFFDAVLTNFSKKGLILGTLSIKTLHLSTHMTIFIFVIIFWSNQWRNWPKFKNFVKIVLIT